MDENSSINSRKFIPLHLGRIQVCVYRPTMAKFDDGLMMNQHINSNRERKKGLDRINDPDDVNQKP